MANFSFPKIQIIDIVDKVISKNENPKNKPGGYFINTEKYQRGIVWSDNDIRRLFKTLLDGFVPPAIIVWKNEDEKTGKYYWEVIDGQQRINAFGRIIRALNYEEISWPKGQEPKLDSEKNKKIWQIKQTEIPVLQISNCTFEEAKEYFTIINTSGKKLNSQETRWVLFNSSDVFKLLDKIFNHQLFKQITILNDEVRVLKLNHNRKKHEEEFTMLFRLWLKTKNSSANDFSHLSDSKAELDNFYRELNYLFEEVHVGSFLIDLVKFHKIFNNALLEKDNNKILYSFYYYLIFFGLFLNNKIPDSRNLKIFINQIYFIDNAYESDETQDGEFLTRQQRKDFMPRRSLNARTRNDSHKIYLEFLEKLND